jgi:hypothetical protein
MAAGGKIVRRSIGIVFDDGGLFALTAALPCGGATAEDEEVAAVLCNPDSAPVQFEEALISTEYGDDGVQRRVSVELWAGIEDPRPLRGAGTVINSVSVQREGLEAEIAFFRWSVEGRHGLGHYEVARADG